MRIAIVGAGVSGLVAAHLLHRRHEIAVFEAGALRGRAHATPSASTPSTRRTDVDTGFIVFNDRNYPRFERAARRLGVAAQPST